MITKLAKGLLTVLLVLGLFLPGCATFSIFPIFPQDSADRARALANDIQILKQNAGEDGKVTVLIKLQGTSLGGVEEDDVVEELNSYAAQSQKKVLELLYTKGATVLNTYWLTNAILAEVPVGLLDKLSSLSEIQRLYENFTIAIPKPQQEENPPQVLSIDYTWGLDKLRVPEVWDMGITGSGVRVAVLDTGIDITHPDLAGKMWTDDAEDPTYPGGWIEFDEYGSIVVGSTPHDTSGHGTHCSGTVLGGDASGIAIGVAPDAILMHGLVAPEGYTTVAQVIAGMEWCVDPFDQYGASAGEPADVVSMSLGYYGYNDPFVEPVQNMKAAGIVLTASIGNNGEGNSGSPGNVYETFGIGATYYEDLIAEFSGGEVIDWPASNPESYIKPDFSAPGVLVYSSIPGGYEYSSGTSMAAPHVAGTVALMLDGNPALTVDNVYTLLSDSAVDLGDEGQDTRYGWGRIDAFDAVSFGASNSGIEGTVTDAETEQPLEGTRIFVSETGQVRYSDDSGHYRAFLPPGTYNVTASNFGYYQGNNATVVVVEDAFTSQDFALEPMPTGFIAGNVTDLETSYPIENAVVTVLDTPLSTNTSGTGEYSIEVPVGTYNVSARALGYLESIASNATVAEDETVTVDFTLESAPVVAVLGDYESQLTDLLLATHSIWAEERGWDIIDDTGGYDVVVVNCPPDPGETTFLEFLEAASDTQTRVVFTSSWGGAPYGISLLRSYLGDPADAGYTYGYGNVYYQVTQDHPLFDGWGVGESITIITGGDYDYAWFSGYSGYTIADIGSEYYGIRGEAVAVSEYGESLHVLLAGLAPQFYTNIPDWTEDAKTIFVRAVVTDIELDLAVKSIELPPGEVGEGYQAALEAMGGTKPYTWAITDGTLPDGLELDNETGIISGTPTESGSFNFTVEVTDATEATATGELSISIMTWTEFITDPVGDQFYGFGPDIVGVDFCLDDTMIYLRARTAQSIDGYNINFMFFDLDTNASTGLVSDDPDMPTNDIGVDAYAVYFPFFSGTTGDLYLWDADYEYFYYADEFPLFTDTDYFWFAIPLDMLNNVDTMHVVDVIGDISEGFTDVAPNAGHGIISNGALRIVTTRLRSGLIQSFYEMALEASGGTRPYTWNIIEGALPNGLDLNPATGVISGTPTAVDKSNFIVEVCDAENSTATASLLLNVFEGCFIATAAYGTDTAQELDILREYRDTVLLPNGLGAKLVYFYYETSPPIAKFISQHEVLRTAVRVFFIDPIVKMLSWTHDLWLP